MTRTDLNAEDTEAQGRATTAGQANKTEVPTKHTKDTKTKPAAVALNHMMDCLPGALAPALTVAESWFKASPATGRRCVAGSDELVVTRTRPFLACALASGAKLIVSKDRDLLTLGKPFGVES